MERKQKEPTPTPKYGSYEVFRNSQKYAWPYEWKPTVAMMVQGLAGFAAGYVIYEVYSLNEWWSLAAGAAVGLIVGIGYNFLASYMRWQKIHWIDFVDIYFYP